MIPKSFHLGLEGGLGDAECELLCRGPELSSPNLHWVAHNCQALQHQLNLMPLTFVDTHTPVAFHMQICRIKVFKKISSKVFIWHDNMILCGVMYTAYGDCYLCNK